MPKRVSVSFDLFKFGFCFVLLGGLLAARAAAADAIRDDRIERGRYLVTVMDCSGCHADGAFTGQQDPARSLAGSRIGFAGPWGVAYPPNLTPDRETGLGGWTEEQMLRAIRRGQRPDGRQLAPAMPWHAYSALSDEDGRALVAYLRTLPPLRHQVPPPAKPGERPSSAYLDVVQSD